MKIFSNHLNKIYIFIVLIACISIGTVIGYIFGQNNSIYQGETAKSWAIKANASANSNTELKKQLGLKQSEIEKLNNKPTPTPVIEYKTQTVPVSQPQAASGINTGMLQVPLWKLDAWDNGSCKAATPDECQ
jgi:hypothetical protein